MSTPARPLLLEHHAARAKLLAGLRPAPQLDDRDAGGRVGTRSWQALEDQPPALLLQRDRLATHEVRCPRHFRLEAAHREFLARPAPDPVVQVPALDRELPAGHPLHAADGAVSPAVDGLAVGAEPPADGDQPLGGLRRQRPVRCRADVEEQVAAPGRALAEHADHLADAAPVDGAGHVAPRAVEGHAGLPGPAHLGFLDVLLGRAEVLVQLGPVVDEDVRLEPADHGVAAAAVPRLGGPERPGHVIPQDVDLAIMGHEFPDAAGREVAEPAAGLLVVRAAGAVGVVPVHQRIIEADLEAELAAGLDVLAHEVPPGAALRGVVVRLPGVPQAEALVVLGGHDHVLHAGLSGEGGPLAGRARLGLPGVGQLLVLVEGDPLAVHHPFVPAELGVQPPMDEHAEAGFLPPLEPLCLRPHFRLCHEESPRRSCEHRFQKACAALDIRVPRPACPAVPPCKEHGRTSRPWHTGILRCGQDRVKARGNGARRGGVAAATGHATQQLPVPPYARQSSPARCAT